MLDPNITVEKREGGEYEPIPDDVYTVQLIDINSEKRPTYDTRNKPDGEKEYELVFNFLFGLLDGMDDTGKELRGRRLIQNFVPSYLYVSGKGKNKLYQIVEALQRQTVSPEQEAHGITGSDLNNLIGEQCRVGTKTEEKGEKKYTNIDKWMMVREEKTPFTADEKIKIGWPQKKDDAQEENTVTPEDIPFD